MATVVLGKDCKLYIGTAGVIAATLVDNVIDVRLGLEKDDADASARSSGGWQEFVGTTKKAEISFEMLYKPADTNFATLRNAFLNDTDISMLVMDGLKATTGKQGLDCDVVITKFEITQPLKEGTKVSVTAKPTPSTRAPDWYTAP